MHLYFMATPVASHSFTDRSNQQLSRVVYMSQKLSIEKNIINALVILATITFCSCNNSTSTKNSITDNLDSLHFTVEAAPEWDALFKRQHGWFGGDGVYSIPLNGKENVYADDSSETLILFSDTVIGDII